jgi:hypothetical protein
MLAVQMIGVHNSAVRFHMRASEEGQTFEGADANVLRAVRLLRLFNEQLQALASLRGKIGQQRVTVEHVHVYEGGQAIVGAVDTPGGREMGIEVRPHGRHVGLNNQHQPREFRRCGAKTRPGTPCRRPVMQNGRCRLHGGLSTGPKTPEGRHRIRLALLKHGRYTKEAKQERLEWRELVRASREILYQVNGTN